jgi:peptide/nickel transport system permease protein
MAVDTVSITTQPTTRSWLAALRSADAKLVVGLAMLGAIVAFGILGPLFIDTSLAGVGKVPSRVPPSGEYPLGTDAQGRDVLATLVAGTPQTLKIGLIAGGVGTALAILLGMTAGYFGGFLDAIVRVVTDVMLTIPTMAILILVAANVRVLSIEAMALIVASLSWMGATRTIRSQVLSLRERQYIQLAKLSGYSNLRIIFVEIMPNMVPYLAASFVLASSGGILAAIGLEVLGLGPSHESSLGMMIYWSQQYDAVFRGLYWWFMTPITMLLLIFVAMFLISMGLDQIANPRLRSG